jgi:hypothetical protein
MTPDELRGALASFTGTENYYAHMSGLHYTDGVAFLAENAGAYWLIDLIASWQKRARKDPMLREFQLWELRVTGREADAICFRDTNDEAFRQHIPFTDFPLSEVKLYLENEVLMLPGEH